MSDALAEAAAVAYLSGWALSAGPFTERTQAGCSAAVATALERAGEPDVLEVSLHLGKLEGTWGAVFKRRDDLVAGHVKTVTAIWRKLVKRLDAKALAAKFRREQMLESDPETDRRKREAKDAALAWLLAILTDPEYADLERAIAAALMTAQAEGMTGALAVAADQAGVDGFSWDLAYDAMLAGLAYMEDQPGIADATVQQMLGGAATSVGRILAGMADSGATDAGVAREIGGALGGGDVAPITAAVDAGCWGSFGKGTLDLYTSQGVDLLGWLTAGDGRVCPSCQDNEDNGPYDPAAFPSLPDHFRCRCCSVNETPLPISAFAAFLVPV